MASIILNRPVALDGSDAHALGDVSEIVPLAELADHLEQERTAILSCIVTDNFCAGTIAVLAKAPLFSQHHEVD